MLDSPLPLTSKDRLVLSFQRIVRRFRQRSCRTPFVIWFRGRTGSSHLCSLLNSHPQVKCRHEDFGSRSMLNHRKWEEENQAISKNESPRQRHLQLWDNSILENPSLHRAVKHLHDIFGANSEACGFKFKYPNQFSDYPEIVHELKALGTRLKVIVLNRRNVLKHAVSYMNLQRIKNQFGLINLHERLGQTQVAQFQEDQFPVSVDRLLARMRRIEREAAEFQQQARNLGSDRNANFFHVDFEDLMESQEETMGRLFEFLDIPFAEVESKFRKATPDTLRDAISNYAELERRIRKTEYRGMLDP